MLFVRRNYFADEAVPDDIFSLKVDEVDAFDILQNVLHLDEPAFAPVVEVGLRNVPRNDRLTFWAEAGQEHLHLARRDVLSLVEDDVRFRERAAAHPLHGEVGAAALVDEVEGIGEKYAQEIEDQLELLWQDELPF